VKTSIKLAKKNVFNNITSLKSIKTGDKVYFNYQDRSLFLARIGKKKFAEGCKIIMAHVDSPHLDLKISPLYEDENLAFFKTHYYGGIKKYQWPTIPLALHGDIYLEDGSKKEIVIGEKEDDTKFMITDLLPHLEGKKERKVKGEDLNLLVGSLPVDDKKIKEKVKLAVLEILYEKYGIKEGDFSSAELQAVPAAKASDIGFDRSFVGGFGHDDKVCSFSSLEAFFKAKQTVSSQICVLIDREDTGSEGASGAKSMIVERFFSKVLEMSGEKRFGINEVYEIFEKSQAISADVTGAVDPDYKEVHDLRNASRMGYGLALERYTGHGGKYLTSEARGEFVQSLKSSLDKNKNAVYQISGGLGKIDQGGGGTIAKYMANRGLDIIDAGVPVFNMHAPLELISKADLYSAYLGYKVFYESE
jgi:aspartyl aminopeptidase